MSEGNNDIFKMELHEEIWIDGNVKVLRVPGGWIYTQFRDIGNSDEGKSTSISSVFVPMKKEFNEKEFNAFW